MTGMVFDDIISIGGNCDGAHHIRRHFGIEQSMPLDWLILPFDALVSLFEDDFRDFIRVDRLALWNGTRAAIECSKRGIVFQHDFTRDENELVIVDAIASSFSAVADKYRRRIERLRSACAEGRSVLFVRSWREILHAGPDYPAECIRGVPRYPFARLLDAIGAAFPGLSFKVLFLNYGDQRLDDPRAVFAKVPDLRDSVDWTGSARGWDQVLGRFRLASRADGAMAAPMTVPGHR